MAPSPHSSVAEEEEEEEENQESLFLASLPKERGWRSTYIYEYQGFWCPPMQIQSVKSFQKHFIARHTDILVVTLPKSGTTWLKALSFSIVNRNVFSPLSLHHPLLTNNPHDLVPFFEFKLYDINHGLPDYLPKLPSPRLFATHIPYPSLPLSIESSQCKIIYLCRNPADTFTSMWHFCVGSKIETNNPFSLQEAFDSFCKGVSAFGPYWNHVLGYWNLSLENPNKVLFLKYEQLKNDVTSQMKKMAEFLRCPFSLEEEREGVIKEISNLCSFENLKNLEVNKKGKSILDFENKTLFRKGEVGDSVNYMSPMMIDKLNKVVQDKFCASGLTFHE